MSVSLSSVYDAYRVATLRTADKSMSDLRRAGVFPNTSATMPVSLSAFRNLAAYLPSNDNTVHLWLDFTDTSTVTTSGVGKMIIEVRDKSSRGTTVTGNVTDAPSQHIVGPNAVARFDNRVLKATGFTGVNFGKNNMNVVFVVANITGGEVLAKTSFNTHTNWTWHDRIYYFGDQPNQSNHPNTLGRYPGAVGYGNGLSKGASPVSPGNTRTLVRFQRIDSSGKQLYIYINGNPTGEVDEDLSIQDDQAGSTFLYIGRGPINNYLRGDVCEILVYEGTAHTTVVNYLKNKHNIA
jgi:hypothetical protein